MDEIKVTTREFLRNYKQLAAKKKAIIISNNGQEQGVFVPYEEWQAKTKNKGQKITREMIEKYVLPESLGSITNDEIDEICYGAPNPHRDESDR